MPKIIRLLLALTLNCIGECLKWHEYRCIYGGKTHLWITAWPSRAVSQNKVPSNIYLLSTKTMSLPGDFFSAQSPLIRKVTHGCERNPPEINPLPVYITLHINRYTDPWKLKVLRDVKTDAKTNL